MEIEKDEDRKINLFYDKHNNGFDIVIKIKNKDIDKSSQMIKSKLIEFIQENSFKKNLLK